jgi:DNA polymerase-3 subunit epsilon
MAMIERLRKGVKKNELLKIFKEYEGLDVDVVIDLLKFQGLPIIVIDDYVILKTAIISYKEAEYVVMDLEVNYSKPKEGQIIEIGAVKLKNLKVFDEFHSLIYANEVPDFVENITGINVEMLKTQKSQKEILEKFRLFLGDSVIVAHDANFDVNFLATQFEKENLGKVLNRYICTINLAKKTLKANRYGLKYLKEEFNLSNEVSHRALADARTTTNLFLKSLEHVPKEVKSVEDLIDFAS